LPKDDGRENGEGVLTMGKYVKTENAEKITK
jgi:hypothetical protein